MAIKVYGSNICPGTMRFLSILTENGVMPQFINVTGSINLLKDFIYLRDTHPAFDAFRGTGRIGFPLVQLEDGTYTTDLDGVLDSFGIARSQAVCRSSSSRRFMSRYSASSSAAGSAPMRCSS